MVGRSGELSRLHRLIADAKNGAGSALVVRGEAGIGKTAMLDYAAAVAGGFRVLRVNGVESEAEIPFAGLQLLLTPFADRIDGLPPAQARALRAAVGAEPSGPGDQLLVGAATLTLLAELADEQPLLCLLDDAHWFDRSSVAALLFAVRRLRSDPVVTIAAARDGDRPFPADGLDSLRLSRLGLDDAARLLASVRTLPPDVAARVLRESDGNPLAILELAVDDPASGAPAPVAPLAAAGRLQEHFRARLRVLPERTRWALGLAAADHRSDLATFVAAARRLDLRVDDLEPAELNGLIRVTADACVFRHPLIRAAAYQDAPVARRLVAHQALAAVLDDPRDADRRAWHLAAAAVGVDEAVATELDRAAQRALARGAPAAASRALERAAQLSGDRAGRTRRLVDAARTAYDSGELDRAEQLAGSVDGDDAGQLAEAGWVRAQVAYERDSPAKATLLALDAAASVLTVDPVRATAVLTEATWCARDAADADLLTRCREQLGQVDGDENDVRDALIAFTGLLLGDVRTAVAPLRGLRAAVDDGQVTGTVELLLGGFLGMLAGDDEAALATLDQVVSGLRADGALGWLPYAHEPLAFAQLVTGRLRDAEVTVAEAGSLAAELGQRLQVAVLASISAWLAAVRGDAVECERQASEVDRAAGGHAMAAAMAGWARAVLDLTRADPAAAADRLDAGCSGSAVRDVLVRAVPDHVEAAVRAGDPGRAHRYLPELRRWAEQTGAPAAVALLRRCEALLDDGPSALRRYVEALDVTGCGPYDRARTQLAYGEWLRRNRRPSAARTQLLEALGTFQQIAATGWEDRVHAELTVLGVPVPDGAPEVGGSLTPRELQVVRLAARGLTNREISAHLFLSSRTVGYHLYKAYPKLGVGRRAELARLDL